MFRSRKAKHRFDVELVRSKPTTGQCVKAGDEERERWRERSVWCMSRLSGAPVCLLNENESEWRKWQKRGRRVATRTATLLLLLLLLAATAGGARVLVLSLCSLCYRSADYRRRYTERDLRLAAPWILEPNTNGLIACVKKP